MLDLVQPTSVVDVGCGTGSWLAVFAEHGVARIVGVDGNYVRREMLEIDPACFRAADLAHGVRLDGETFDLAVSLEVAEHLPPDSAHAFVQSLVCLAPIVLFSAAIPFQGGTNHVNEQWQDYWAGLFVAHGFVPIDALRSRVWANRKVAPFYAQNMLLYVRQDRIESDERLRRAVYDPRRVSLNVVHPEIYETKAKQVTRLASELGHFSRNEHLTLRSTLRILPRVLVGAARRRLARLVG